MSKRNLIEAFQTIIHAIESNTIEYDWSKVDSCNCGLVAKFLSGSHHDFVAKYYSPMTKEMQKHYPEKFVTNCPSWGQAASFFCPLTGEPTSRIFKILYKEGLTREDIGYLETLSDPRILKISGIDTTKKYKVRRDVIVEKEKEVRVGFLGLRKVRKKYKETENKVIEVDYYEHPDNLAKYLRAWISILEGKEIATAENSPVAQEKYRPKTVKVEMTGNNKYKVSFNFSSPDSAFIGTICGTKDEVTTSLNTMMVSLSKDDRFEEAVEIRNAISLINSQNED